MWMKMFKFKVSSSSIPNHLVCFESLQSDLSGKTCRFNTSIPLPSCVFLFAFCTWKLVLTGIGHCVPNLYPQTNVLDNRTNEAALQLCRSSITKTIWKIATPPHQVDNRPLTSSAGITVNGNKKRFPRNSCDWFVFLVSIVVFIEYLKASCIQGPRAS